VSVFRFADPIPVDARRVLGGKGASLAEMTRMGLPVPPGFTLPIGFDGDLDAVLRAEIAHLETLTQLRFGETLLVAVRSGAPSSMPGMLDTVLNVGGASARGLGERLEGNRALDVRRRFLESYATVVLNVPRAAFDAILNRRDPRALEHPDLHALIAEYERAIKHETGQAVPDDPFVQLAAAVEAVRRSWSGARAQRYREAHGIAEDEGTAVTVQAMVYGNAGASSGAGVVFSRNPSTGERALYGEWSADAQGEDIVSGRRTPSPLTSAQVRRGLPDDSLERVMPEIFAALRSICGELERVWRDAVDVELTIERGVLYVLQCRPGKRNARAAARIAVELVGEGMITQSEALARIEPHSLRQLLTPRVPDPQSLGVPPIARGLAASPGAATGKIVLDGGAASKLRSEEVILVRAETSAEDVEAMRAASGILTSAGGLTSHAAVVARAMGKPCVAGATSLAVDYARRLLVVRGDRTIELPEGYVITIDGTRGLVYGLAVPVEPTPPSEHVEKVLAWADGARRARVLAQAGSARLAQVGMSFGADAIAAIPPFEDPIEEIAHAAGGKIVVFEASDAEELAMPKGRAVRGERALSPETLGLLGPDDAVIVPPLDVPVARLALGCAARS
jgi:pyruvate,orthophosphate dikinase